MTVEMTTSEQAFKALGDPTRLRILRVLSCCPERLDQEVNGTTAGAVCCQITGADKISSTISHHLKELREAGLIQMERNGKNMICTLDREALKRLAAELLSLAEPQGNECC